MARRYTETSPFSFPENYTDAPVRQMYGAYAPGIQVGHAVRLYDLDTDDWADLAIADSVAHADLVGVAIDPITSANYGKVALGGIVFIPTELQNGGAWPWGYKIYLSDSIAGEYTIVLPTASGSFIVPVGRIVGIAAGGHLVHIERGEILEIG